MFTGRLAIIFYYCRSLFLQASV